MPKQNSKNSDPEERSSSASAVSRRTLLAGLAASSAAAAFAQQPAPLSDQFPGRGEGQGSGEGMGPPPGFGPTRESTLADLKGQMPQAPLGKLKISRVIIGGNPMGGFSHSRDLSYVGRLMKAYFTNEKISETLALAEKCGINAFLTTPMLIPQVQYHWKQGGKIQFISDGGSTPQASIDAGAAAVYIQGQNCDRMVSRGNWDGINNSLELIRKNGLPAGIGAHSLDTIKACVAKGLTPDFWMKTFHSSKYWSANVQPEQDNNWCPAPDDVIAFMKDLKEPWIAFKVMAAGAIAPKEAFQFAFQNGADFICAGMFDWQVVDNTNTTLEVVAEVTKRERPWRA
jgi:hypothetical protein